MKPGTIDCPIPLCVLCKETLSNQSMKPSLLKRHLQSKHPELEGKPLEFFQRKASYANREAECMTNFTSPNSNIVKASYLVSLRIAKTGKEHTVGETLILPATKDIVKTVLGDKAVKEINKVSLSDNTVKRRIDDMALNVEKNLILQLKECTFFALQLDESTDVAHIAQLLVFVRYDTKIDIQEEFLFCKPLKSNTTAAEIFQTLENYIVENGLNWTKCIGVCTDGAGAMSGHLSGVVTRINQASPSCKSTHCVLHREALAMKNMPPNLQSVLENSVKIINFIKSRALNSRLFSILCDDMGSNFTSLLLHTEVRWLSRGKALNRLFELRSEVLLFLNDTQLNGMKVLFSDELWLSRLAYLCDIFARLNDLSLSLQGRNSTLFEVNDKIVAFKRKLHLLITRVNDKDISGLHVLKCFAEEHEFSVHVDVFTDISNHLKSLKANFDVYFKEDYSNKIWIRNPYAFENEIPEEVNSKEKFIDLVSDGELKLAFKSQGLISFWMSVKTQYSDLYKEALQFLIPFATTYLCESGFSALVYIKNKYRGRLDVQNDLRLKLTNITPDIDALLKQKQHQVSH